jgi:hypothetical protein
VSRARPARAAPESLVLRAFEPARWSQLLRIAERRATAPKYVCGSTFSVVQERFDTLQFLHEETARESGTGSRPRDRRDRVRDAGALDACDGCPREPCGRAPA